jgi:ubiquinone/menaquinone biosynthesis C-methylase UbiE
VHSADVHALPFQARTFEFGDCIGVIPWLHSERVALREMRRVLKPGGYLLVTADNNARLNRILDPLSSPLVGPRSVWPRAFSAAVRVCGVRSHALSAKRHYSA